MGESAEPKSSTIVGPLNFSQDRSLPPRVQKKPIDCLLCCKKFTFPDDKDLYLAHLFIHHKLVISDEHQIAFLDEYMTYWREKFQGKVS